MALLAAQLEQLRSTLGTLSTDEALQRRRATKLQSEQKQLQKELHGVRGETYCLGDSGGDADKAAAAAAAKSHSKANILSLQTELQTRLAATQAAVAATLALREEGGRVGKARAAVQAEHEAAERKNQELKGERDVLVVKARP